MLKIHMVLHSTFILIHKKWTPVEAIPNQCQPNVSKTISLISRKKGNNDVVNVKWIQNICTI